MSESASRSGAGKFTAENLEHEANLQQGRSPMADVAITSQTYVALCRLAAAGFRSERGELMYIDFDAWWATHESPYLNRIGKSGVQSIWNAARQYERHET